MVEQRLKLRLYSQESKTTLSNYSVAGSTLLSAGGLLKRLNVTLDIALGVPLTLTENTTGELTLASNSYSYGMVDTLLAAKQNSLSVSSVTGSSLLSGTVLKRLDIGTGLQVSDSGYALNISASGLQTEIANSPGAGSGGRIDLWNNASNYVKCLEFFSNPTGLWSTLSGSDAINCTIDLSAFALTSSVTLLLSQSAAAAATARNALYLDALAADDAHAYSKSVGDGRYYQTAPGVLELQNPTVSALSLKLSSNHTSNSQIRFKGGALIFRRTNSSGTSNATHITIPNTNTGNTVFNNSITASSFQSSSDRRLKDNELECDIADVGAIVDRVSAKKYERNDRNGELRVGFIADDLKEACQGHYACILGEQPILDDEGCEIEGSTPILTVDYPRLTSLLWTCVRDLRQRVATLEAQR